MKKVLPFLLGLFAVTALNSQSLSPDVVATAGDYFTGEGVTLSWTLGEVVIETISDDSHVLTQGFQQSFYRIVGVDEIPDSPFSVEVYPNPARDHFYLEIHSEDEEPWIKVELFDFTGNLALEREIKIESFKERISLSTYATNMMMLRITDCKSYRVQSFKILKVKF